MGDFETHPVGTADLLERLRSNTPNMAVGHAAMRHAADRIEQLEAELTRANAATAAAYEVAANLASFRHDENQILRATWATPSLTGLDDVSEEIRALATPDQTAALDRLIAEAEARVWEKAAEIANDHTPEKHGGATLAAHVNGRNIEAAILAASKKGGA